MTKIYNIYTNNLICEESFLDLKQTLVANKDNLRKADLRGANLKGISLKKANLSGANLEKANLSRANLEKANLKGTNLNGADLRGTNLLGAKITDKKIINYKEVDCIGNMRRQLRCFMLDDNSFYFMAGCFSGTEKEFKKRILAEYGKDCEYMEAIKFLKKISKKYKWK